MLLSFASFERAREELQLSDAFIVVVIRSIIISTTTEEHQTPPPRGREKKSEFLSRFLLLFFSGSSLSLSVVFRLLFLFCFFRALSSRSLFTFFFVRENTHHNNTRPKIMVRSLYT